MSNKKNPLFTVFLGIGFKERVLFKGALQWPYFKKKTRIENDLNWKDSLYGGFIIMVGPITVMLGRFFGFFD